MSLKDTVPVEYFMYVCMLVAQSYPTLCDPINCSPPGSSVHVILQAKILEWVASPFFRGSSSPRDPTRISCIVHGFFTIWAIREAPTSKELIHIWVRGWWVLEWSEISAFICIYAPLHVCACKISFQYKNTLLPNKREHLKINRLIFYSHSSNGLILRRCWCGRLQWMWSLELGQVTSPLTNLLFFF